MKLFYTLSLLLICSSTMLFAQSNGELIRPLDFVSQLEDIFVDETGNGWAGGSCGVLLKTEDRGENWVQVDPPIDADIEAIACSPNGCQTNLLIIFEGDITARSTDNGENWTMAELPPSNAFANRLDFLTDDIGLAYSNNDEILRTTDGGTNWDILEFPNYMSTNISFPTSSRAYFFNGDNKLYKTNDQGATWDTTIYTHPVTVRHLSFWSGSQAYLLDQNRHLYRTDDGGESFYLVNDNTGLPLNLTFMTALSDNKIRGVQVSDRVWQSNDGGESWDSYSIDLGDGSFVKRKYHEYFGEFWLVSNLSSIFYAESDFSNWVNQIPGERLDVVDMAFTDNQTGFLTDRTGALFKSTDAGATWSLFDQLSTPFNKFYALPDGRLMVTGGVLQPRVSDNGGMSFTDYLPTTVTDLYPNEYFNRYAQLPSGRIYLTAGDVAIYSDDNGENWNDVDLSMLPLTPQNQLYFFDDNLGFMLANGGGRFARTTDGGLSWENMTDASPTAQSLKRIWFSDADNGILFGSSRAYRTTDGGDTWALDVSLPGASGYEIAANGQILTTAFAGGNNGTAHLSNDAGESWSEFDYICAPYRGTAITPDNRYFFGFGDGGVVYRYDLDIVNPTAEAVKFTAHLKAYPNPTNGTLNLNLEAFPSSDKVVINDLYGRQMFTQKITAGSSITTLELGHLPAGMYIVNLYSYSANIGTQRIVITH